MEKETKSSQDQESSESQVEQITKIPEPINGTIRKIERECMPARKRQKKKQTNMEAREALAEKERKKQEPPINFFTSSINHIQMAAALVGVGFTLYHGWTFVKPILYKETKEEQIKLGPVEMKVKPKVAEQPLPKGSKSVIDMD